jgi:hypothetical protein
VNVCVPTVMVPVRVAPLLEATENCTVPLPLPEAPLVIVTHGADVAAVQLQPDAAVTARDAFVAPPAPTFCDDGLIPIAHDPACVTVKVCVPTVMVPVRVAPLLAATENCTVPLPLPDAPPEIVIQGSAVALVQLHPEAEVTAMEAFVTPPVPTFCDDGLIPIAHDPACVIVNV